jgi:ATP-binding cassette, subfamily C, bacterial CydD
VTMSADQLISPALRPRPSVATKDRLAMLVAPGQRSLILAGTLLSLAAVAAAAGFFAVASVAQDVLDRHASWPREYPWLLLLAGSSAVRVAAGYLAARLATGGALIAEQQLQAQLIERLLGAGSPLPSAAQATAVMDEAERIGAYAERYRPARLAALLVPLALLVVVFPQNWVVGALLVLCAPLPALNLSIVGLGTAEVARRHGEELRQLSGYLLDRLRGLATLRLLGADRSELKRMQAASARLSASSMAVLRVAFVSAGVLEAIVTVSVAIVAIYVGLTLLGYVQVPGLPSHMTLRTGLFLLMVTPLYFQPVRALAAAYHERAGALAAAEALAPLLDIQPPARHSQVRYLSAPPLVAVESLSVRFPARDGPALAGVSAAIGPGKLVGLTGASGAGKSTLLRAIAGDLRPSSGRVLVNGAPADELSPTAITWLGQRPYLFSGTIAENISAGSEISEPEIAAAALLAGLGEVLQRLPDGLQTPVGEDGWGLSGGEAHRIALARAFVKRAPLMLLDEPTAHLDAGSEAAMIEVIAALAGSATTIVASHSPAVLAACDRVITLDRGALVPTRPRAGAAREALA